VDEQGGQRRGHFGREGDGMDYSPVKRYTIDVIARLSGADQTRQLEADALGASCEEFMPPADKPRGRPRKGK
jgi:hypothetical protein